jgi:hypothetical protein
MHKNSFLTECFSRFGESIEHTFFTRNVNATELPSNVVSNLSTGLFIEVEHGDLCSCTRKCVGACPSEPRGGSRNNRVSNSLFDLHHCLLLLANVPSETMKRRSGHPNLQFNEVCPLGRPSNGFDDI